MKCTKETKPAFRRFQARSKLYQNAPQFRAPYHANDANVPISLEGIARFEPPPAQVAIYPELSCEIRKVISTKYANVSCHQYHQ